MSATHSYTTADLTKLADELETDIGVHERMLISKHRLRELVAALRDARDWLEAITESSGPGVPDSGSVGPWKECVYKHPDAPSAFSRLATLIHDIEIDRYGNPLRAALGLCNDLADEIDKLRQAATSGGNK